MRSVFLQAAVAALTLCAAGLHAQTPLRSVLVADGLSEPTFLTHAPGDFIRLFVLEKPGRIRLIKNGTLLTTPFLDLTGVVHAANFEVGLLGLAFSPAYQTDGFFYVCFTGPVPENHIVIRRYKASANPDIALTDGTDVLVIPRPQGEDCHNGGWIGFGPDGYLYMSSGDAACACDPDNNAQTLTVLAGKMLRIDVSALPYTIPPTNPFASGGGRPEIWAYGLRNPWRASIDRQTGDLWIADVGQNTWEEINFQAAPGPGVATARNYGWHCREGPECTLQSSPCGVSPSCEPCASPQFSPPIHFYSHAGSACAVTGGYVYRGCAIPDLRGTYFYSDFCSAEIWSLVYSGGQVTNLTNRTAQLDPGGGLEINVVTSFGEDALGELYVCDFADGEVYKIVPQALVGPDCNANGVRDECDIWSGFSLDLNSNGIPDECECYANCDGSHQGGTPTLTVADFGCFQTRFVQGSPWADCTQSNGLTVADFGCFQTKFIQGCP